MDAVSRSNKGFADDDEDEEEDFGKNDTYSPKGLTVKVDGGSNNNININNQNNDQKPSTPRSKHSATEQRRRSKINDRRVIYPLVLLFQILRSLIPHSDQKRDKASFLLEVIEYIQFLQEKVQKYESSYPEWSHDNVKLMPWKNGQTPGESMIDASHIMKNGPVTSGFIFPTDSTIAHAPAVMLDAQNLVESENVSCGLPSKSVSMQVPMQYPAGGAGTSLFLPQHRSICDSENMATQPQAQWLRSCTTDCSVSTDILSGQEDLVIDEGTISLSSMYSEGLLNNLTQALQSSGVDLSQASISVQLSLGRQAISRPMSSTRDPDDPSSSNQVAGHSRVGSSGEESEQANKRRKFDAI
ncbi:hypothetical protein Taro_019311 [Colocasia esculenta]|uniref:BHLH domain-containing protein n=1 Tax=Colocasia esculenta TaxID=4460 RepID=A0A843UT51_COLES|nr:hypothetical protein [Colocasia esculenta]